MSENEYGPGSAAGFLHRCPAFIKDITGILAVHSQYYASLCRTAGDSAVAESVQQRHDMEVTA